MYHQLAHLYDWPGALEFADKILLLDLGAFSQAGIAPGARVLDLACGTGTLTIHLAKAGYQMTGLDISESMLAMARRKHEEAGLELPITWVCEDMRTFLFDEPFDAVVCHYDSLNHLSNETELRGTFLQVSQALRSGGLFLFDLNTLENYRDFWQGSDTYEGPNYRLKTRSSFNEDLGKAEAHFTVDEHTEDCLVHREETLYEQYFNERAVEKYLMAAEFVDTRWQPFNPVEELPPEFPLKTFWRTIRQ